MKNIKFTTIFLLVFVAGFITSSFVTHNYSKNFNEQKKNLSFNEKKTEGLKKYIYIISPRDGDEVTSPVKIIFGLKGMGVAPSGIKRKNTGHHHLLINLEKIPDLNFPLPSNKNLIHFGSGQTETELKLKKGVNTLQLILGDYIHKPHETPLISNRIKINVL